MKKLNLFIIIIVALSFAACKKAFIYAPPSGNLLIANMVAGGGTLTYNGLSTPTISNYASTSFPVLAGQAQVNLANNAVTPAAVYYNQSISAADAGNYSLFLAGTPAAIDAVLITESYTNFAKTDSLCGVRFINLAPGSNPISVNVTGQASGSTITSLAYKAYSNFIQFPAKAANTTYAFQVRDATTGNLISSYTLNTPFFHNVTIVLRGVVGGSPAAGVTAVMHP